MKSLDANDLQEQESGNGLPLAGKAYPLAGVNGPAASAPDSRVKRLARNMTEAALNSLRDIMDDATAPASARVSAATAILNRGWGAPSQELNVNSQTVDLTALHLQALRNLMDEAKAARTIDAIAEDVMSGASGSGKAKG
jgi:hypothetical protein